MYCLVKFCRLCLSFKKDLNNMCNDNIIEKATACIGDLEFDYNLPSLICNECLEMLDLFFNFRNRCLQSEFLINCYIEKLFQSKLTKEFKSTELVINIVNNIGVSPVKNYNKHKKVELCRNSDVQRIPILVKQANISINKLKQNYNLDEADDIFLEEEDEDENQCKPTLKRKLSTDKQSGKKLKTSIMQSSDSIDLNNACSMFTDITERVKLRKRQVQLKHNMLPAIALTRTTNFQKSSNIFKSSILKRSLQNQQMKPSGICLEKANESSNNIKPVSKLTTNKKGCNKSLEGKELSLVEPSQVKPKIQVCALESFKSSTDCIVENNDLYKANFSNILQLNSLDSASTGQSVNKETPRPFKILFDNIGHDKSQVKIQYVPVLKPVKSKRFLSYLNNNGIVPNDSTRSLLNSNQQTSKRYKVVSTVSNESTPTISNKSNFQTIRNEHNYSTESNDTRTANSSNKKNNSKNVNPDKDRSFVAASISLNSAESVNLKDKINKTWAKFIVLKKTDDMNLQDTDMNQ